MERMTGGEPETDPGRRAGFNPDRTAPPEEDSGVTPHETVTKGRTW